MKSLEKELNLGIFSSDKVIEKKTKAEISKYSSTKVKARNFLTNVSYNGIKDKDYQNRSFVIDIFSFLILYLNPFYLERKFEILSGNRKKEKEKENLKVTSKEIMLTCYGLF